MIQQSACLSRQSGAAGQCAVVRFITTPHCKILPAPPYLVRCAAAKRKAAPKSCPYAGFGVMHGTIPAAPLQIFEQKSSVFDSGACFFSPGLL
jgi:hypothetical protein